MNLRSARVVSAFPALLMLPLFSFCLGCGHHPAVHAAATNRAVQPASAIAAAPRAALPPVSTSVPPAKSFITSGPLVATQQADISAERDGRVVQVTVQIGDRVRRGQVLATLDDRALRLACKAKQAEVASLQAQVLEWQAEQRSVEANLRRATILRDDNIMSKERWEYNKAKRDETVAEVARYQADAAAAQEELAAANLALQQSRIVAPFAGVVGRTSVEQAQQVKTGETLFWITAEAPLRVLFTVPESLMASFSTGAKLQLTTADYPGLRQSARILRVSPVVDPASGSVQVIGAVAHPSPLLKPGMSMRVRLAP